MKKIKLSIINKYNNIIFEKPMKNFTEFTLNDGVVGVYTYFNFYFDRKKEKIRYKKMNNLTSSSYDCLYAFYIRFHGVYFYATTNNDIERTIERCNIVVKNYDNVFKEELKQTIKEAKVII